YSTMRTLHWSSTSFGYMNPSTPGMSLLPVALGHRRAKTDGLPHRAVQSVVVDLGACRHLWLQHLNLVRAQVLVRRIVRVLQIGDLARARRTDLDARGDQPLG